LLGVSTVMVKRWLSPGLQVLAEQSTYFRPEKNPADSI
jgi:hypothetical protein